MHVNTELMGRDIWVKYTDKNGKSFVKDHCCWDVGLFLEAQQKQAAKEGGKVEQVLRPPFKTQSH